MARTVAGAGGGSGVRERLAGPVQIEEKIVFGGEMTSFKGILKCPRKGTALFIQSHSLN
jgi:hypothetical protein